MGKVVCFICIDSFAILHALQLLFLTIVYLKLIFDLLYLNWPQRCLVMKNKLAWLIRYQPFVLNQQMSMYPWGWLA